MLGQLDFERTSALRWESIARGPYLGLCVQCPGATQLLLPCVGRCFATGHIFTVRTTILQLPLGVNQKRPVSPLARLCKLCCIQFESAEAIVWATPSVEDTGFPRKPTQSSYLINVINPYVRNILGNANEWGIKGAVHRMWLQQVRGSFSAYLSSAALLTMGVTCHAQHVQVPMFRNRLCILTAHHQRLRNATAGLLAPCPAGKNRQ